MKRRKERLVVLTLLGVLAINYPVLSLASLERMVWGVPLLWFYLLAFWVVFVILIALTMRRGPLEKS
ncbi:MAG: hypothetical protein HQL91_02740 [Magnetococcales bacterium]|nr:hypothetical protein [Magnetococcales bacterium]